jgi:acyl-[acyl-carrier-protein] desaturase
LNRHISTAKKWNPHEYIPWERGSRLATEGFLYGENSISDNLKSSFIINLLTEDSLPWYSRTLSEVFGRESVVGEWIHRWTAEEARHSYTLRSYITLSGILDPVKLEKDRTKDLKKRLQSHQSPLSHDIEVLFYYESKNIKKINFKEKYCYF